MKTRDQIISFIAKNKDLFRNKFHITKIGIFGSFARGEQNKESDLDLIVEFEDNTQNLYDLKLDIKEFFRSELGIEIDICREKYIKPRIKRKYLKRLCMLIKDKHSLESIIEAIDRILEYTSGIKSADELNEDYRNFDATMMNFIVIPAHHLNVKSNTVIIYELVDFPSLLEKMLTAFFKISLSIFAWRSSF
jgi:uncharacterized protein